MKGMGSGAVDTDNPFTQVMGLVTQMYKQTAIAKVMGDQVVLKCSFSPLTLDKAADFVYFQESCEQVLSVFTKLQRYILSLCANGFHCCPKTNLFLLSSTLHHLAAVEHQMCYNEAENRLQQMERFF